MSRIFVDSGAWISFMLEGDLYHEAAVDFFREMESGGSGSFTSNYVVDETLTRLLYDQSLRAASEFYKKVKESVSRDKLTVFWIDASITSEAYGAFVKFA